MALTNTVLQSTSLSTPQTALELAAMLRDPNGNLRCPFGTDFQEQSCTGTRIDGSHRIPFWLALVELYGDGYRYGSHSDKHLPHVFEQVVDVVVSKRQERSQGAPEHLRQRFFTRSAHCLDTTANRDSAMASTVDLSVERECTSGKPLQLWISRTNGTSHFVLCGRKRCYRARWWHSNLAR